MPSWARSSTGRCTDERGLHGSAELAPEAREHLVAISAGDARAALNVLEAAAGMAGVVDDAAGDEAAERSTPRPITLELIEAAAQQRILTYDRTGDGHYGTVSAFIKSMRGNDVDATLYWLATMVAAGEDPRFIMRRIVIAPARTSATPTRGRSRWPPPRRRRWSWSGLPEAQYALAQAAAYVAQRTQVGIRWPGVLRRAGGRRCSTAPSPCRPIC